MKKQKSWRDNGLVIQPKQNCQCDTDGLGCDCDCSETQDCNCLSCRPTKKYNTGDTYNGVKCIAVEDLITLVCTEFVKQNKIILQDDDDSLLKGDYIWGRIPYLKMNYKARRKLSEKLLAKMEEDYAKNKV